MTAASRTWRRVTRRLVVALALGLVLPLSWTPSTMAEHARAAALVASVALVSLLAVHRPPTAEDRYAAALVNAVALEVRLGHVRVASVHEREGRTHGVITWREATATLLDADGRPLAMVMRNALATGWTMSVRFDDPVLPKQLGTDSGRMVLHASVDTEHDPWARVGNSPLRLQRCEVAVSA